MNSIESIFGIDYKIINQYLAKIGLNFFLAIIIFVVGFWLTNFLVKTIKKVLIKSNLDLGLITFLTSLLSVVLKLMIILTGISQLGVQMTSFLTLLGAIGLAIGMAFSGTLSNFAGGVMVLIFKPFKVGDFIQAQGEQGIVKEILIFNTYLSTTDNKLIILPNGPLANGNIINFTKAENRRVDFVISISYGDDFQLAKDTLKKYISEDNKILKDPEPFIGLGVLGNSSIDITMRVWTKTENYWLVFFEMNEKIYNNFPSIGLNFPFPQMDVHLKSKQNEA
jgi:small conductance mechanosensitive channel